MPSSLQLGAIGFLDALIRRLHPGVYTLAAAGAAPGAAGGTWSPGAGTHRACGSELRLAHGFTLIYTNPTHHAILPGFINVP